MTLFQRPKIIAPDYDKAASFTFYKQGHFYKTGYGIIVEDDALNPHYLLGLMASTLLFQYLVSIGTTLRGGYIRFWTQYLEKLPIRTIEFSNPEDVAHHDKMVELVQRML